MYDFTYISVRKALLFKELIPTVTPGKDKRPETLAERKVEKRPEPFETNRRATELPPQPTRPAQQKKPSMPMQPANSGISAQPTPTPSVTMENSSSSPVEIQYLKEDNQSGKNITNNMVAENIVPYLTQRQRQH